MELVSRTKEFVQSQLLGEGSGHDWWHIERVHGNSLLLLDKMQDSTIDREIVELAALLHDIADWKFHNGDETIGPKVASEWLRSQSVAEEKVQHIAQIIRDVSFKGTGTISSMKTKEGEIVQDADRLDAIGAIGIARAFAYGGYKEQEIYNPTLPPKSNQSAADYKMQQTTSLNHFFEKLLRLKDRMNTPAAIEMAEERHQYMVIFLKTFFKEVHLEQSVHAKVLAAFENEQNPLE